MSKEITTNQILARLLVKMNEKEIEEYLNSVDKLDEILDTPPTEQEVCEALGEYWKKEVVYDTKNTGFYLRKKRIVSYFPINKYLIQCFLPPHLITLIGRFYEGKVKE